MSGTGRIRIGYHDLYRREILELIPTSAKKVLDLGCGTGELGKALKQRQPCHVTGIELNKEAHEAAKKNLDTCICDNLNRFNPAFLKETFDCIILAGILEHVISPWQVLNKFTLVLKYDGTLVASIPNIAHPWIISQLQKGLFRYATTGLLDVTHLRFFTKTTISQMFCRAGLKITKITPWPNEKDPRQYHVTAKKPSLKFREALTTIVILSYNTLPYTIQTIENIKKYTHTPHKILVIDNGSTDGSVEYLRADNTIFHIENSCNLGIGRGFNVGLALIDTSYFVLCNSDIIATEGWLTRMIEHIDLDKKLLALAARFNNISGPQLVKDVPYKDYDELQQWAKTFSASAKKPLTYFYRLAMTVTLFKSPVLRKIGFFDERYEIGNFEDDDYCLRILGKGFKCAFDNTVFIHHYGSQTFKANKMDYNKILNENKQRFLEKWKIK